MQSKAAPRERRRAAGLSQMALAVEAGVSLPTLRLYEANPESVSEESRRLLDAAYSKIKTENGKGRS